MQRPSLVDCRCRQESKEEPSAHGDQLLKERLRCEGEESELSVIRLSPPGRLWSTAVQMSDRLYVERVCSARAFLRVPQIQSLFTIANTLVRAHCFTS